MTDDLQLARARKHSPGYAEYLEARAAIEAEAEKAPPPPVTRTLDDRLAAIPPERRDPQLEQVRAHMRGEVGTGAGEGATGQDTGTAWVTRSADCPEAPAQAHLPADDSEQVRQQLAKETTA